MIRVNHDNFLIMFWGFFAIKCELEPPRFGSMEGGIDSLSGNLGHFLPALTFQASQRNSSDGITAALNVY